MQNNNSKCREKSDVWYVKSSLCCLSKVDYVITCISSFYYLPFMIFLALDIFGQYGIHNFDKFFSGVYFFSIAAKLSCIMLLTFYTFNLLIPLIFFNLLSCLGVFLLMINQYSKIWSLNNRDIEDLQGGWKPKDHYLFLL